MHKGYAQLSLYRFCSLWSLMTQQNELLSTEEKRETMNEKRIERRERRKDAVAIAKTGNMHRAIARNNSNISHLVFSAFIFSIGFGRFFCCAVCIFLHLKLQCDSIRCRLFCHSWYSPPIGRSVHNQPPPYPRETSRHNAINTSNRFAKNNINEIAIQLHKDRLNSAKWWKTIADNIGLCFLPKKWHFWIGIPMLCSSRLKIHFLSVLFIRISCMISRNTASVIELCAKQ